MMWYAEFTTDIPTGPAPLKTESLQKINHHKKAIKVRGQTANGISKETEEGGCICAYRQWTPEQKFSIIMEYYNGKLPVSDLCRKQCAVENEQPRVEVSIW